jgi:hypothetical protein
VVRVCERLRKPLARLAGVAGFRSLLSRAVALARAEIPSLVGVQVRADVWPAGDAAGSNTIELPTIPSPHAGTRTAARAGAIPGRAAEFHTSQVELFV